MIIDASTPTEFLLKFMITDKKYISVQNEEGYRGCCDDMDIDYVDEETNFKVRIGIDSLSLFLNGIEHFNNLPPVDRQQTDIGLEENYRIHKSTKFIRPRLEAWTDTTNSIPDKKNFSFIYQDLNGDAFIEIVPMYPDHDENAIPFDEWIKDYKPIAIVPLSKETIKSWREYAIKNDTENC